MKTDDVWQPGEVRTYTPTEERMGEVSANAPDHGLHSHISSFYFVEDKDMDKWEQLLVAGSVFVVYILIAFLAYIVLKRVIIRVVQKLAKATENHWDDELVQSKFFRWVALLVPAAIIWNAVPQCFEVKGMEETVIVGSIIKVITKIFIIAMALFSVSSLLNVAQRIYSRYEVSKELPIKSFVQVLKIVLSVIGVILIVATVLGKSPALLFSGLGAMTAVLMLIFKDSLLGLVAGVQLSANRMVARGDWIEMPKFGADGEVLEVALTTVKVRNWDKTITTIPTYALISDSFKNWRGMSTSGVRRIKRSLFLDINSVKFLDDGLLNRLSNISLLKKPLAEKQEEISTWNSLKGANLDDKVNARSLTNLGMFRMYVNEYMKAHPQICDVNTLLVRQLQPTENGLPLEIYVFSDNNQWVAYESIQSDIFDHLFAVLKEFDLQVFQSPTGNDFVKLRGN